MCDKCYNPFNVIRSRTIYIPEKREQEDYNDMTMIEINSQDDANILVDK